MKQNMSSISETARLVSPFIMVNPPTSKKTSRYQSFLRWFLLDSWMLEYLAMTVSISALLSIVITLVLYNGKPLNDWPYSIQFNTVLSVLATGMKGFLLVPVCSCLSQLKWLWYARQTKSLHDFQTFDDASRGPWGALKLFFRLKSWHMASIGSIITLLSLASDAFVQQSVSYPTRFHSRNNYTATLPYSQYFDSYDTGMGYDGPHAPDGATYTAQRLLAAIYDGVFSGNLTRSASAITGYCPVGNCSFQSFASLAVCSHCENVTSLLQLSDASIQSGRNIGVGHSYNISLPNGHRLVSTEWDAAYINITASKGPSSLPYMPFPVNSEALSVYQSPGTISNISVIAGNDPSSLSYPVAWDCVLSFCARSYNASQSLGIFNEIPIDVFDELKSTVRPEDDIINQTITFDVPLSHLKTIGSRNRTFSMDPAASRALQNSLGEIFAGKSMRGSSGHLEFTSGVAQGFYYNGVDNVVMTMADVADALTNLIRVSSGQHVEGLVSIVETYIQVQWWWLLLPLIMLIMGTVFLALTVLRTHNSGVPSWRSSVLAIMEHGVNTYYHEETGVDRENGSEGKEKISDLEVWAKDVSIRLRRRGLWGREFGLTVT
jgi:Protein of unknown function (DUF3176)